MHIFCVNYHISILFFIALVSTDFANNSDLINTFAIDVPEKLDLFLELCHCVFSMLLFM